jgi:hypothetical protein
VLAAEDQKTLAAHEFFTDILGVPVNRVSTLNLDLLDLPHTDLGNLGERFTEGEILAVIRVLPPDKALGPDRFTGHFL